MSFNPNDIGVANGNFCGLPVTEAEAELVIIPVPWDATTSYARGTADGPQTVLDASLQLDLYHHRYSDVWKKKIFMTPISQEWREISENVGLLTTEYIQYLSEGGLLENSSEYQDLLAEVAETQRQLKNNLKEKALSLLQQGKKVAVLGGEHSTPLGLLEALNEHYPAFGILQIDAHADLRNAYEGFEQSHASIIFNALKLNNITKLVQVGIRDLCEDEVNIIDTDNRIKTYYDWELKRNQFTGMNWDEQCQHIIQSLPEKVYISFDIDGLQPALCPSTGTPVPGGLSFEQAVYLLQKVKDSGKEIIGFDLNEVAPGDEINGIVGARILMEMCLCAY
jgi:agmatinase